MRRFFPLLLSGLCFSIAARASDVLWVDAKQRMVELENDPIGTWKLGEEACIVRDLEKLGCGQIRGFTSKGAILVLMGESHRIRRGDTTFRLKGASRTLASAESSVISITYEDEIPVKRKDLEVGYVLSLGLQFPAVVFEYAVTGRVVLGVEGAYVNHASTDGAATLTGMGGLVSGSYYFQGAYRGPFLELGTGMLSYSASGAGTSDSSISPTAALLFGWRARWATYPNIGIAVGGQYTPNLTGKIPSVELNTFYPVAMLTLGYEF